MKKVVERRKRIDSSWSGSAEDNTKGKTRVENNFKTKSCRDLTEVVFFYYFRGRPHDQLLKRFLLNINRFFLFKMFCRMATHHCCLGFFGFRFLNCV